MDLRLSSNSAPKELGTLMDIKNKHRKLIMAIAIVNCHFRCIVHKMEK